jgi:hypothetical protein
MRCLPHTDPSIDSAAPRCRLQARDQRESAQSEAHVEELFGRSSADCTPYKNLPRLINCGVDDLHPHPSYVKHQHFVSPDRLAALTGAGNETFQFPILVTRTGVIIDGYARWELARQQGQETIACLEYDLSDEEALRWLIQMHSPSKALNSFCRSLLALDLEPSLQESARANQRTAGQMKGSSNLTEAQKVDVRSKIASIANVSTGSLTKAKRVLDSAIPEIQRAARAGEISVHRAWMWSSASSQQQVKNLEEHRSNKGTKLVSRRLIQKHVAKMSSTSLFPASLNDLLKPLIPDRLAELESIAVTELDAPGRVAYLTNDAMRLLRSRKQPECQIKTC